MNLISRWASKRRVLTSPRNSISSEVCTLEVSQAVAELRDWSKEVSEFSLVDPCLQIFDGFLIRWARPLKELLSICALDHLCDNAG